MSKQPLAKKHRHTVIISYFYSGVGDFVKSVGEECQQEEHSDVQHLNSILMQAFVLILLETRFSWLFLEVKKSTMYPTGKSMLGW